jgi:hypothetical protein
MDGPDVERNTAASPRRRFTSPPLHLAAASSRRRFIMQVESPIAPVHP